MQVDSLVPGSEGSHSAGDAQFPTADLTVSSEGRLSLGHAEGSPPAPLAASFGETTPNAAEAPGEEAKDEAAEEPKTKRPRPLLLVECDKPLPGRQDEHIHARLQFIYFKIHETLGVKDKRTIYKDFEVLWKNKYRGRVTVDMKDELTLEWLENAIDIVMPRPQQTAVEAASGAETCSVEAALLVLR